MAVRDPWRHGSVIGVQAPVGHQIHLRVEQALEALIITTRGAIVAFANEGPLASALKSYRFNASGREFLHLLQLPFFHVR
jgi:hypothetical protein